MKKDKYLNWPPEKKFRVRYVLKKDCELVIPLYDNEKGNKKLEEKAK